MAGECGPGFICLDHHHCSENTLSLFVSFSSLVSLFDSFEVFRTRYQNVFICTALRSLIIFGFSISGQLETLGIHNELKIILSLTWFAKDPQNMTYLCILAALSFLLQRWSAKLQIGKRTTRSFVNLKQVGLPLLLVCCHRLEEFFWWEIRQEEITFYLFAYK